MSATATAAEEIRALGLSREMRELELPEARAVGPWRGRSPTRKAILGGRFYVYGHAVQLDPPIDWLQDPHGSRTWRYELHTLSWLKEALSRHAASRDVEALAVARDTVLDWTTSHLRSDAKQSEFAWYDMAVGLRAPYVAYVLRACLAEAMLDDDGALLLIEASERHGAELSDRGGYSSHNNHGLFQDEGLYLLAALLPSLPAAPAWRELALTRMEATLRATVDFEEGVHLEHSPAYQVTIVDLVARLADNVGELTELPGLLDRLRRTAAWQTTPAGRMVQLGDSDDSEAPQWARDAARSLRGFNALHAAGQAFVREGDSYLAVSAAHHSPAHKHADDTGFVLVEGGRVLLGDAGRWGYYETEDDRLYARSAAAHNVLTVDGEGEWWREDPYGSALLAVGEEDGWYAIVVANPHLARQGVEHRRLLLHRPGEELIVVDRVRSERPHDLVRRFHFGPEVEAKMGQEGEVELSLDRLSARLVDAGGGSEIELSHGEDPPDTLGWSYPGDRERVAVWTAALRSRAQDACLVASVALGEASPVAEADLTTNSVRVRFDDERELRIQLAGHHPTPASGTWTSSKLPRSRS